MASAASSIEEAQLDGIFLECVAIVDLTLGFYHLIQAFVLFKGEGVGYVRCANNNRRYDAGEVQTCKGIHELHSSEAFVKIYRCWIVWNRSWRMVIPSIILWLGTLGTITWIIWIESSLHAKVLLNAKQLRPAGASFWVLSIVLNIITAGLLIYKIWRVEKQADCRG
ncbi:hypothetical protein CPB83DRAFT_883528 [Crepidotus variabilis]|uniref:Uncharacterized protein n=1 Tax=Crepidotus variabilis TaxID=179855 RepID=A0A9P6EFW4_9AGAR|nr:hypothetical protein CPB83DRAFT_883528 [Crepidotus variabilis]